MATEGPGPGLQGAGHLRALVARVIVEQLLLPRRMVAYVYARIERRSHFQVIAFPHFSIRRPVSLWFEKCPKK